MFTFDLDDYELPPMGPGLRVSFPLHSATGTASTPASTSVTRATTIAFSVARGARRVMREFLQTAQFTGA